MLGDKIKVASLPEEDEPCPTGKHLVVSGWGQDVTRPLRSLDKLWAVVLQCLDPSSCPRLNDMNPKTNMICAGDPERLLSSACYGDSGGMVLNYIKTCHWNYEFKIMIKHTSTVPVTGTA